MRSGVRERSVGIQPSRPRRSHHRDCLRARATVSFVAEEFNIVAMAEELALLMADDLEVPVSALDVLDWLASTGLTLRPGEGDASVAYQFGVVPDPD